MGAKHESGRERVGRWEKGERMRESWKIGESDLRERVSERERRYKREREREMGIERTREIEIESERQMERGRDR